jgi:hypothetical protein
MDNPVGTSVLDELRSWTLVRALTQTQEQVWEAVTGREAMRHWSADEVIGTRSLGAPITVARRDGGEPENGGIVAFNRPRRFSYTAGGRTVSWEIVDEGADGTSAELTVTLDADAPGPADEAQWDRQRRSLEQQCDDLERYLSDGAAPAGDATRPFLSARRA